MSSLWRAASIYKRERRDPPDLEVVSMQGFQKHEPSGQRQASRENCSVQAMHELDASRRRLRIQQSDELRNKDSELILQKRSSRDSTPGGDRVLHNNGSRSMEG